MVQADGLVLTVRTHNAGYSGCKQVRQLLVARPGQKPCAWVSFDSLRSSLLSWHGYALMAVARRQDVLLAQSPPEGQAAQTQTSLAATAIISRHLQNSPEAVAVQAAL